MKIKMMILIIMTAFIITACGANADSKSGNSPFDGINASDISQIVVYPNEDNITDEENIRKIYAILTDMDLTKIEEAETVEISKEGGYSSFDIIVNDKTIKVTSNSDKYLCVDGTWYKSDRYIPLSELADLIDK